MSEKIGRRQFLRLAGLSVVVVPAAVAVTKIGRIQPAFAQDGKALDESLPMAQGLGYKHDATKADPEKRKLPEMKDRFCKNCMLYQQGGLKAEGQEGEWGKCGIFPQGLVNANGWCMSWSPKAA